MNTTFIYALCCPITEQIKYIGKANNPNKRFKEHLALKAADKNNYKSNWISSLLKKNLQPELLILDEILIEEWQFWEDFWIQLVKTWEIKLTNLKPGGLGKFACTSEMNRKTSETMKRHWRETPERFSKSGKPLHLIENGDTNRKRSLELHYERIAKGLSSRGSKIVIATNIKTGEKFEFYCARAAVEFLNPGKVISKRSRNKVQDMIKGRSKSYKGYVFKYKE